MLKTIVRYTPTLAISIFHHNPNENDVVIVNNQTPKSQTGWERVKQMYSKSEHAEMSLELTNVLQSTMSGAFIGGCVGGFVSSRVAYLDFIENNQATIFKSTAQAKKRLQDSVTIAFAKGAYRWGWRLSFFTGLFSLTATTVSVYRGNTSLVEYITAGAVTGALYKIDMGLAATLVGATLGAVLSAIGGLAIIGLLKVTGLSMDDIRKALYKLREQRIDQYNQALEKGATIKNDEMTATHNWIVKEHGEKNIEALEHMP